MSEEREARGAGRRFFTTSEVARYCAVSSDGVLRWIKAGKLRGFATPGGHYRIPAAALREFLERYRIPVDEALFGEVRPTRRVLIVVGDAETQSTMERMLAEVDVGIVAEGAADGYAAGIEVGMRGAELVILDLSHPRVDALALCRSIRSSNTARGVRVLTLARTASSAREGFDAGADSCLTLPLEFEELRHEIRRLLGESSGRVPGPGSRRSGSRPPEADA